MASVESRGATQQHPYHSPQCLSLEEAGAAFQTGNPVAVPRSSSAVLTQEICVIIGVMGREGGCHLLISHTFATDTYFEVSDPPSISGQADETPLVVISPGELLRDAHQIKVVSWSGAVVDSFGVWTSPQRASSDLGIGR